VAAREKAAELALAHALLAEFPHEAAIALEAVPDEETAALLASLAPDTAANVVRRLDPDLSSRVIAALQPEFGRRVLTSLSPNRAAALLARLDDAERERCLSLLEPRYAEELRAIASYPPDSAGALMDPRATSARADTRVQDMVRRLRRVRDRRIDDIFLVDDEGRLTGVVSSQDAVLALPEVASLGELGSAPISVQAVAPREEVVETFESHRLRSLPVVDFEGHLLGVLRQRELVQASREAAMATAVTMTGASDDERALSPPLFAIRKRQPWLQINLLTAFLAAAVVGLFEDMIARVTALAVLLPVVAGQSGNTGAQALAVTMRGLALREVRVRHWLRVVAKEVLAGAGNGIAIALTTAGAVYLWSRSPGLALVIGSSMVLSMTLAGLAGAAIPMLLTALRQDPAQSSSIILTTVTDVVGFFSFLGIASLLVRLL
jgi:magnesium transporter